MNRIVFLFCMLVVGGYSLEAQIPELTFESITTKEGLPSNDVWSITKDPDGFLWLGTARSICRYDGYRFLTFKDAQIGYASGVSADSKGTIYASIDSKGFCKIERRSLTVKTLLENNYADKDTKNDLHEKAFVDTRNHVWLCDYTHVKRYDPATGKLHFYRISTNENDYQYASFFEDSRRRLWIISEIGVYRYLPNTDKLECLLDHGIVEKGKHKAVRFTQGFEDIHGNVWVGSHHGTLTRIAPNDHLTHFSSGFENADILCGVDVADLNGQHLLLLGTETGLRAFYPEQQRVYSFPAFYKSGIPIKTFFDDKENGLLWMGTKMGLYKYRYKNIGIRTFHIAHKAVNAPVTITSILPLPNGHYLLGLSHTGVLKWAPETQAIQLFPLPKSEYIHRLRWIGNQAVALSDNGIYKIDFQQKVLRPWKEIMNLVSANFTDVLLDAQKRLWISSQNHGLHVLDYPTLRPLSLWTQEAYQKIYKDNLIKSITQTANGKIWFATCGKGLFYWDEPQKTFVNVHELPFNKGVEISSMCNLSLQNGANNSVLLSGWGGVDKIETSGKIGASFDYKKDDILDTYCSNILEDPRGNFWFSTNEGIQIGNVPTRSVRHLSTIEGLYSNSPVGFYYHPPNELLLGHINHINILKINEVNSKKLLPKIVVSAIEVSGQARALDTSQAIGLQPHEKILNLQFSTLNFEPSTENVYQYQLEGFSNDWVNMGNQNTVSFTNLAPKTYTLRVKSGNSFGFWTTTPLKFTITVEPYFTETWWFKLIIALMVGIIVAGLIRWRLNTLQIRNQLELQMSEWKLKALQSQMNPHFLFNSLNSVQNYLLQNRGVEGAKYLSKFSRLVRRIMENSNHQYLRFEEIIETLKMYVEMEAFRFSHEFSYEFNIDEDEDMLDTLLPPMLLQPYVENAIWHGLMPKEGDKKLVISARCEGNYIFCTIQDNGVGRQFAPRREGHISRGQEMTRGIFESLKYKDKKAKIQVVDLFDVENQAAGTRIEMFIPTAPQA
ncbi:ligand-binding sensor domain-containing protein [Runella defluvii]|uniref:Ligand-binding sensor domain-containing protein n=1 Tax=Runella defluvii TaxID=370973 RepID=A0A7W5ZEZ5_9BACT|nr:two-component regulator propeller domain-containing protein [Runella defluvii]MBB3836077.1 ligand-binding sensor domain-containing protein [Runella defluvii]